MSKNRIFIGLNNIAGVALNLAEGFHQNNNKADFYSAEKEIHPYDYPEGYIPLKIPRHHKKWISKIWFVFFFIKLLFRYKYFIYLQAGWTMMRNQWDIKLLHFFRKKTMVILTGCDSRIPEKVLHFKWNPCNDCPEEYKQSVNCNGERKKRLIQSLENNFDYVVSADECAGLLTMPYFTAYFPRVVSHFEPQYPVLNTHHKIRILHAPTNLRIKGTNYIRAAITSLERKYSNFEFIEAQGLPLKKLYDLIKTCDLVIDQLIGGFYGLLAVESMALGKPVVVYIRPDIWNNISKDCPVYNANPDTLTEVLEQIILHPSQLEEKGRQSRAYVEKYHDATKVASDLLGLLNQ